MSNANEPAYPSKPYKLYTQDRMAWFVAQDISPCEARFLSDAMRDESEADALLAELARTEG